jgi:hypothetical protein
LALWQLIFLDHQNYHYAHLKFGNRKTIKSIWQIGEKNALFDHFIIPYRNTECDKSSCKGLNNLTYKFSSEFKTPHLCISKIVNRTGTYSENILQT